MASEMSGSRLSHYRLLPSRPIIAQAVRRNTDEMRNLLVEATRVFIVINGIAWMTLWICVFIYGSFYYSFLPKVSFHVPIYFNYDPNCLGESARKLHYETCHYPQANFSLLHNRTQDPFFVQGQQYQLLLEMNLPETDLNRNVGLFMVSMQFFENSRFNREVFSRKRSSSLVYKSEFLRNLETVFLLPFYLTGYKKQSQHLVIDMGFFTSPNNFVELGKLEVESRDVVVESASFIGTARFTGVRYWLYFYPITVAALSIFILYSIIFPIFVGAYFRWRHLMPVYFTFPNPVEVRNSSNLAVIDEGEEVAACRNSILDSPAVQVRCDTTTTSSKLQQVESLPPRDSSGPSESEEPSFVTPCNNEEGIRKRGSKIKRDNSEIESLIDSSSSSCSNCTEDFDTVVEDFH